MHPAATVVPVPARPRHSPQPASGSPAAGEAVAPAGQLPAAHGGAAPSSPPSPPAADLRVERDGPVGRLTIDRPHRRNAMTWQLVGDLRNALAAMKADPGVHVVVLGSAGDGAFCAGADLGGMVPGAREPGADGFAAHHDARGELAGLFGDLWHLGKPTVARVQGAAVAGGFGLALACDLLVASDRATFAAPEVDRGLWPYMVTVPMLRSMPAKKALELMLTARTVDAEEADRLGFVTRVVPAADLDAAVDRLAATLAAKPPGAVRLGRESFYAVWDQAGAQALPHLHAMLTVAAQTEEAAEGIAAFFEKRPPKWTTTGGPDGWKSER